MHRTYRSAEFRSWPVAFLRRERASVTTRTTACDWGTQVSYIIIIIPAMAVQWLLRRHLRRGQWDHEYEYLRIYTHTGIIYGLEWQRSTNGGFRCGLEGLCVTGAPIDCTRKSKRDQEPRRSGSGSGRDHMHQIRAMLATCRAQWGQLRRETRRRRRTVFYSGDKSSFLSTI